MSIAKLKNDFMKSKSTAQYLSEKFGGKWKHVPNFGWECDDGNRYVWRVLTGRDMNGEYTGDSSLCLYYRNNEKPPEWC